MALFKWKKKKESKQELESLPDREKLIKQMIEKLKMDKQSDCHPLMVDTNTCYCIGCAKVGKCAIERMAKASGCVTSYTIYCSLRDNEKEHPTRAWAEIALRPWNKQITEKFGLDRPFIKRMEDEDGKEEGKGGIQIIRLDPGSPDDTL